MSESTWEWREYGLVSPADGRIVISASASATCPKKGDYYGCDHVAAEACLFVAPEHKNLIAAAPDLLEAMKEAIELADRNALQVGGKPYRTDEAWDCYNRCVAAITKATEG